MDRLALFAVLAVGVGACASTPKPPARPSTGAIQVLNTTDRCPVSRTLPVTIGGESLAPLAPGTTLTRVVPVGQHRVEVGPHEVVARVAEGETWRHAQGCAHRRTLGGEAGARLTLSVRPHACRSGSHGVIAWLLDGDALARQLPGAATRVVRIPPGSHRLVAMQGDRVVLADDLTIDAAGEAARAVGCGATQGAERPRVFPLTVHYAPPEGCQTPLLAGFAGKVIKLRPQTAYTAYLPAGRHQLVVAGRRETRTLETAGSVVRRAQCIETVPSDGARKTTP